MDNKQVLEQIKSIKENSIAFQRKYGISGVQAIDEIGGHVGYQKKEKEDHVSPSKEFMNSLFEECALGLGFEYERR